MWKFSFLKSILKKPGSTFFRIKLSHFLSFLFNFSPTKSPKPRISFPNYFILTHFFHFSSKKSLIHLPFSQFLFLCLPQLVLLFSLRTGSSCNNLIRAYAFMALLVIEYKVGGGTSWEATPIHGFPMTAMSRRSRVFIDLQACNRSQQR